MLKQAATQTTSFLQDRLRRRFERLLAEADVRVNGPRPWDMQVHNEGLWQRLLLNGSLGLGEAYMDSWWDCDQLDEFFYRVLRVRLQRKVRSWVDLLFTLRTTVFNLQKKSRAFQIGERHYDIGNDLYERMLDRRMTYSCGYWRGGAQTLDEAQEAKIDLVCRKLGLEEGMRVLDIGCGWGGAVQYAAERYGVEAVGITVSREQAELARERCKGLPVDIRLQDYRDLDEPFDRIFSIGMFEHVGHKNYRTFMELVRRCLPDDGLFVLHTIGSNRSSTRTDPWTERYIFPNSMIPSAKQIAAASEGLFILEDWHSFGTDYDKTLMAWRENFDRHWDEIADRYGERFYRMWTYYLCSSAGAFRSRNNQLWQIVFSPRGVEGGYVAPR